MKTFAELDLEISDTVSDSVSVQRRQVAMVSWDGESVHALALMSRIRGTLSARQDSSRETAR